MISLRIVYIPVSGYLTSSCDMSPDAVRSQVSIEGLIIFTRVFSKETTSYIIFTGTDNIEAQGFKCMVALIFLCALCQVTSNKAMNRSQKST